MTEIKPIIVQDTREQAPVSGWFKQYRFVVETLPVGDYGISGFSTWANPGFVIERKSLDDLVQSLTHGRDRFWREVEKLRQFRFAAIAVEAVEDALLLGHFHSQATPQSIQATLDAIIVRTGVHVLWCGTPEGVAARIESLVRQYVRGIEKEWKRLLRNEETEILGVEET